jgi:hypothetical protein
MPETGQHRSAGSPRRLAFMQLGAAPANAKGQATDGAAINASEARRGSYAHAFGEEPRGGAKPIPAMPSLLGGAKSGATRQEVITLDEGDVVISFPENLSAQSFGDLKDHLALFIKKMQRRAYIPPGAMGRSAEPTILGTGNDNDDEAAN